MQIIKTILVHLALATAAAWILMTPQIFRLAAQSRIYPGIGGEIFWPFIPLFVWGLWKCAKDTFSRKGENNAPSEKTNVA